MCPLLLPRARGSWRAPVASRRDPWGITQRTHLDGHIVEDSLADLQVDHRLQVSAVTLGGELWRLAAVGAGARHAADNVEHLIGQPSCKAHEAHLCATGCTGGAAGGRLGRPPDDTKGVALEHGRSFNAYSEMPQRPGALQAERTCGHCQHDSNARLALLTPRPPSAPTHSPSTSRCRSRPCLARLHPGVNNHLPTPHLSPPPHQRHHA